MHSNPNSFVSQPDAATTQLTYALQLNPAPLTVSLPNLPVIGSLQFVATNPTASAIAVSYVSFTVQIGTASDNLTATTAGVGTAVSDTANWVVVGPNAPITSGPAVYTLQPATGSSVTLQPGQSVLVQIYGFQTVAAPGNTTVGIKEMIGTTPSFTSFLVTTFPAGFFFNGLSATVQNGSQLTPAAQVVNGATVTLVWNSSVVDLASFTIYYSNASQGQRSATPTDTGEWTSPALTSDTVFTVVVTVSIAGGQPLSAALSTAVSVQNPALIAASITTGQATVTGAASVSGALSANAITATGLTVNGAANMSQATVTGAATVNGTLTANAVTTPGLTVSGNASIGNLTANNALTASGPATMNGGLNATAGVLSLLTHAQAVGTGNYNAKTDGLVVGVVSWPATMQNLCNSQIFGSNSDGVSVIANGGCVGLFDSGFGKWSGPNAGTFVLPVRNGTNWSVSSYQPPQNQVSANFAFYWIPLGTAPGGQSIERIGDAAPPAKSPLVKRVPVDKLYLIPQLLDVIDSLLAKPMPSEKRTQLTAILEKMNSDEYTVEEF